MLISSRPARHCLGPALLALIVTAADSARAEDGMLIWIVEAITYDEDVIPASAMQVPHEGTKLATGQQISTAAGQHMVLVHGRDLVKIQPNTTVVVGDEDVATPNANLDVVAGTVQVEAGKRAPGQTFSVGTTYLVATVKGTQFDVNTSSAGSVVSVTEGVVAVSSLRSGKSVDVTAGGSAAVRRGATGAPSLNGVPAGSTPSRIGADTDIESASAKSGGSTGTNSGGSNSGGSNSGGSNSGGSSSGGSSSGGSSSGGSGSGGGLGGAVGGAADKAGGAVAGVGSKVGGAIGGKVGGAVSSATGKVGGAVSGVGKKVGGAVDKVGKAVGGLLGGK